MFLRKVIRALQNPFAVDLPAGVTLKALSRATLEYRAKQYAARMYRNASLPDAERRRFWSSLVDSVLRYVDGVPVFKQSGDVTKGDLAENVLLQGERAYRSVSDMNQVDGIESIPWCDDTPIRSQENTLDWPLVAAVCAVVQALSNGLRRITVYAPKGAVWNPHVCSLRMWLTMQNVRRYRVVQNGMEDTHASRYLSCALLHTVIPQSLRQTLVWDGCNEVINRIYAIVLSDESDFESFLTIAARPPDTLLTT